LISGNSRTLDQEQLDIFKEDRILSAEIYQEEAKEVSSVRFYVTQPKGLRPNGHRFNQNIS